MRLPDAFSMRQKPAGVFRALLRVPVWLYRWDLGRLLGTRFLLMTHRGRRSGATHQTVVEVVHHDVDQGEWVVCSGTGPQADWYRNLQESPAVAVQVGDRSWTPAQRFLDDEEAAATYHAYETAHPRTARRLLQSMGNSYDGTHAGRVAMMADMPMVAFSDTALDPGTT